MTILESVKKTNRPVIVEEQWPFASISSEISYRIQKEGFDYWMHLSDALQARMHQCTMRLTWQRLLFLMLREL